MTEKIFGYLLFLIGFSLICYSGISVYQVFTKKILPVKLFNLPGIRLDAASLMAGQAGGGSNSQLADIMKSLPPDVANRLPSGLLSQAQPSNGVSQNKPQAVGQEIISGEMLNFSSNLFAHLMLMGFVASIGFKISSLGIQLIRPIVVKLKEEKPTP